MSAVETKEERADNDGLLTISIFNNYLAEAQNLIQSTMLNSQFPGGAIPLCVPFQEKDIVKQLGAKWCPKVKGWFWPFNTCKKDIAKWLPRFYQENLGRPVLSPDIAPCTISDINLQSILTKESWSTIEVACNADAGYRCQICGAKGTIYCVEDWSYIDEGNWHCAATLLGLLSLCARCKQARHLVRNNNGNQLEKIGAFLASLNNWDFDTAESAIAEAYYKSERRSYNEWRHDFSWAERKFRIEAPNSIIIKKESTGECLDYLLDELEKQKYIH